MFRRRSGAMIPRSGTVRSAQSKVLEGEPTCRHAVRAIHQSLSSSRRDGHLTWKNDDNVAHDVPLLAGSAWRSQPLPSGDKVSDSFAQAGEYPDECRFHPRDVKGKVIVAPSALISLTTEGPS